MVRTRFLCSARLRFFWHDSSLFCTSTDLLFPSINPAIHLSLRPSIHLKSFTSETLCACILPLSRALCCYSITIKIIRRIKAWDKCVQKNNREGFCFYLLLAVSCFTTGNNWTCRTSCTLMVVVCVCVFMCIGFLLYLCELFISDRMTPQQAKGKQSLSLLIIHSCLLIDKPMNESPFSSIASMWTPTTDGNHILISKKTNSFAP